VCGELTVLHFTGVTVARRRRHRVHGRQVDSRAHVHSCSRMEEGAKPASPRPDSPHGCVLAPALRTTV
jgi:hypothetical protein